jgi:periplasmic protein TonB
MSTQATLVRDVPAKQERNRIYPAAGIALVLEVVLLGGMWFWFTRPHPPAPPPPVTISLAPVQQAKPAPKPVEKPKPKEIPKPVHRVVEHVVQPTPPKPVEPKPLPTPIPTPDPVPVPTPKPPPPQPPAPSRPDASFEARLRAAIQAALRYPEAARMANLDGHPVVGFTYRDGVVSNVHLVRSGGSSLLDAAALAAVRNAAMPMPPQNLAGRSFDTSIRVDFTLEDAQ